MSTDACKSGDVKVEGKTVKPSYLLSREEIVLVKKNGFNMEFKVVDLIDKRVSAPLAQACYIDITSEEELNKYKSWFKGKAKSEMREKGAGRPTKRERREIDEYKDHQYDER